MTLARFALFAAAMGLLCPIIFAQNPGNCSLDTIKGDYGFVSTIRLLPPANSQVKTVQRSRFIGLISYDGAGKVTTGGMSVSPGGKTSSFSTEGTYTVDGPHCTGSVTFKKEDQTTSKWDFVIVSGGSELLTVIQSAADTAPFSQKKR